LSLTPQGRVHYTLKTPYRDGTTHVVFEPLDFMARLAALVPKPRVHLTRYHGVFAPHSRWRAQITPLQSCEDCGGQVRVIACIEDPLVIGKILAHLETSRPGRAAPVGVCGARNGWEGGDSGPNGNRFDESSAPDAPATAAR
jgi:hypothetical protein